MVWSDGETQVVATSSGDQELGTQDDWIVTDDGPNGDPTVVQVISGADPSFDPTTAVQFRDGVHFAFQSVVVPAGGRAILMHFASQNADETAALASAEAILGLQGSALSGLSPEERAAIVNFGAFPDAGALVSDLLVQLISMISNR